MNTFNKVAITALVATTALTGVAHADYASSTGVRDALTDVFDDLGGNFADSNSGDEYAELLYMIDNQGTVEPITITLGSDSTLNMPDGGAVTGSYTLQQILDQVDVFEADLEDDLFSDDYDDIGTIVGSQSNDGSGTVVTSNNGLAIDYLENIVTKLNEANAVIADTSKTLAEKEAARNEFMEFYTGSADGTGDGGARAVFNSAVNSLVQVAESLGAMATVEDLDAYKTAENVSGSITPTDYADTNETYNILVDGKRYESYTDFVAGIGTYVNVQVSFTLSGFSPNYVEIPEAWSPTQWSATIIEFTVDGDVYRVGVNWNGVDGTVTNYRLYEPGSTNDLYESDNWSDIVDYVDQAIAGNQP